MASDGAAGLRHPLRYVDLPHTRWRTPTSELCPDPPGSLQNCSELQELWSG